VIRELQIRVLAFALTINHFSFKWRPMSDFTTALERELERIEGDLQRDPRYRRIKQIRDLLTEYKAAEAATSPAPSPTSANVPRDVGLFTEPLPTRTTPVYPSPRRRRLHLSKAASIKLEVEELLKERGKMHRSDILQHLIDQKLMGHEKKPLASLAAYLSDWRETFMPDGHGNFSLKKSTAGAAIATPASH
jgi:hypothetical protein